MLHFSVSTNKWCLGGWWWYGLLTLLSNGKHFRKRVDKYVSIRKTLEVLSFIPKDPNVIDCGTPWTKNWTCNICITTHFCTIKVVK